MMTSTISVTWLLQDGSEQTFDVPLGLNLMEGAVRNGVPGIEGDCGGAMACATCHVCVLEGPEHVKSQGDMEEEMLEMVDCERTATSRLSCQIVAEPGLDGLVLRVG